MAEHFMYYLSISLRVIKVNSLIKCCCLVLIFFSQKLPHYFIAHCLNLVTKSKLSSTYYLD